MPYPKPGEKRSSYIQRAIQTIRSEEPGKDMNAVLGKAYGMWRQYGRGRQSKKGRKHG